MSDAQTGNQAYVEQCRENAQHLEAELEALRGGHWDQNRRVYKDFFAHATVIRQLFKDIKLLLHKDRERLWQQFQTLADETKRQQQDEWQKGASASKQKRAIIEAKIEEAHYATAYAQTIQDLKIPNDLLDQALGYMKNDWHGFDSEPESVPAFVTEEVTESREAEICPAEEEAQAAMAEEVISADATVEPAESPAVDEAIEPAETVETSQGETLPEYGHEKEAEIDAPTEVVAQDEEAVLDDAAETIETSEAALVHEYDYEHERETPDPSPQTLDPRPQTLFSGPLLKEDHDACWKYMQQVRAEIKKRREGFWKVQFDALKGEADDAMTVAADGNPHDAQKRVQELQQQLKSCEMAKWQFEETQVFLRQVWEIARLRIDEQKQQRRQEYAEWLERQEGHMARWADQISDCDGLIERIEMEIERLHGLESGARSKDFIERVHSWIDEKNAKIAGIRKNIRSLEDKIESVKNRLKTKTGDRRPEAGAARKESGVRRQEPRGGSQEPGGGNQERRGKRRRRRGKGPRPEAAVAPTGQGPEDLQPEGTAEAPEPGGLEALHEPSKPAVTEDNLPAEV